MAGLSIVTGPDAEPVTLGEAQLHAESTQPEELANVASYLIGARQQCENFTGRAFVSRTYDLKIDWRWPCDRWWTRIVLPQPPLVSVTSVSYVDTNGATQALAANQYQVSSGDVFGVIVPAYGVSWPSVRCQVDAITVRFAAGYGTGPGSVPEPIRQAIRLLLADSFENREGAELPPNVRDLLSPYKVFF